MERIVSCGVCGSRYKLNEALLKGARGARIRCRSCGGGIVVRNEEARDSPVPAAQKIHRVEDLFLPPAGVAGDPDSPARQFWEKPFFSRLSVLLSAVLLVLAVAGVLFVLSGPASVSRFAAAPPAASTPAPAGSAAYETCEMNGYLDRSADGCEIFVIRGTVANVGKSPGGGIRIRAALIGADNQVIAESRAFAGNIIDEALLRHMNSRRIEEFLGLRGREKNGDRKVPMGGRLPFMVVFPDPPGPIASFTVEAMEAAAHPSSSGRNSSP